MSTIRSFKQKLAEVFRLWEGQDYDKALNAVEELLSAWPGNVQLHVLWAGLVQLQDNPEHNLDEVKQALQRALDLDRTSPAAAIELGHYLDAVEDNPRAAARAYADGIAQARRLLIEGMVGRAKALLQLGKRDEAVQCVMELLYLTKTDAAHKKAGTADAAPDYSAQIEALAKEVLLHRSA